MIIASTQEFERDRTQLSQCIFRETFPLQMVHCHSGHLHKLSELIPACSAPQRGKLMNFWLEISVVVVENLGMVIEGSSLPES